jgi:hypothetical protein
MKQRINLSGDPARAMKLIEETLNHLLGVGQNVEMAGGKVTGISPGTNRGEALTLGSGATGFSAGSDGLKVRASIAGAAEVTAAGIGVRVDNKTIKINGQGQIFVSLATASKLKESGKSDDAGLMVDDDAMSATYTPAATTYPPSDHATEHVTGGGDVIAAAVAAGASGLMTGADKTKLDGIAAGAGTTATAWPVGSVFISVVSTNPATLLGFGTWSQIAQGRMLIGQNGSDTDFDAAEETGGAKTANIAHTHTMAHDHDISHSHPTYQQAGSGAAVLLTGTLTGTNSGAASNATTSSGGSTTQSIMNPYFVTYIWKRTA